MRLLMICLVGFMGLGAVSADETVSEYYCDRNIRDSEAPNKKYEVYTTNKTYSDAHNFCFDECMVLATVKSDEEFAALQSAVQASGAGTTVWLGGYCANSGRCEWMNKGYANINLAYFNRYEDINTRHEHFPRRGHNCVAFKVNGSERKLEANRCSEKRPFVCQYFEE